MNQFNFDIMDAAGYGYYRVWKERNYLLKLIAIPVFIKFASMVALSVMGDDSSLLRQGLVLLPSDFAKGWVVAQFLRTLLLNERWPTILNEMPDNATLAKLLLRARGIIAATLAFVLISMAGNLILYFLLGNLPEDALQQMKQGTVKDLAALDSQTADQDVSLNPLFFIPSVLGLLGSIWLFRLLWLYVPFAVLMPLKDYLFAIRGFMSSLRMLVLYFSCMAPVMLLAIVLARGVHVFFVALLGDDNMLAQFFTILISVGADFLVTLVVTAAMAWAMRGFLPKAATAFEDFPRKDTES